MVCFNVQKFQILLSDLFNFLFRICDFFLSQINPYHNLKTLFCISLNSFKILSFKLRFLIAFNYIRYFQWALQQEPCFIFDPVAFFEQSVLFHEFVIHLLSVSNFHVLMGYLWALCFVFVFVFFCIALESSTNTSLS